MGSSLGKLLQEKSWELSPRIQVLWTLGCQATFKPSNPLVPNFAESVVQFRQIKFGICAQSQLQVTWGAQYSSYSLWYDNRRQSSPKCDNICKRGKHHRHLTSQAPSQPPNYETLWDSYMKEPVNTPQSCYVYLYTSLFTNYMNSVITLSRHTLFGRYVTANRSERLTMMWMC